MIPNVALLAKIIITIPNVPLFATISVQDNSNLLLFPADYGNYVTSLKGFLGDHAHTADVWEEWSNVS